MTHPGHTAPAPFAIGLTGGIGSGKTTVANLFEALGATIIDTDALAHQLTSPGGQAIDPIRMTFGEAFITPDGAMDRARMRDHVFTDPMERHKLESLLHPLIRQAADAAREAMTGLYPIFVVPLLFESGTWRARLSRVLVVDCPEDVQIARVMARNNLPEATIRAVMAAQMPRQERLALADDVIENTGDMASLQERVAHLHAMYLSQREG